MARRFLDRVVLDDLHINLHGWDEIIKLQLLLHKQISSPRFFPFIKHCWFKGGYVEEVNDEFQNFEHPVKFCFPSKFNEICNNLTHTFCGHFSLRRLFCS